MLENTIRIFYEIVMSNYNGIADNIIFIDVNDLMTDELMPVTNEQQERYYKKNYFYKYCMNYFSIESRQDPNFQIIERVFNAKNPIIN